MAKFCSKCGTMMEDDMMFCANCGAKSEDVAPVENCAQTPAAGIGKIDPMAIIKGTADAKLNWIVALAAQVLAVLLFLLPIVRAKASAFGMSYAENAGMFKALGDDMGPVAVPIIFLIITVLAIVFMALPLIQKTELNPINAAVMLCAQAIFFITNIIMVLVINGKAREMSEGMMTAGFSFWGWLYLIFALVALFLVGRIVYANKDSLLKK